MLDSFAVIDGLHSVGHLLCQNECVKTDSVLMSMNVFFMFVELPRLMLFKPSVHSYSRILYPGCSKKMCCTSKLSTETNWPNFFRYLLVVFPSLFTVPQSNAWRIEWEIEQHLYCIQIYTCAHLKRLWHQSATQQRTVLENKRNLNENALLLMEWQTKIQLHTIWMSFACFFVLLKYYINIRSKHAQCSNA